MGRARVDRTAAVIAASAALHLLLLSALAIEATRSGPVQVAEPPAIQVTLERAPPSPPEPKPLAKTRKAAAASTPAPQRLVPAAPAAQPVAPSAPRIDAGETAAMGDVLRALRGSVGCANPDAVGLTPAEREGCRRRLDDGLEDAKPILGLTAEKRARFDHVARCQDTYRAYKAAAVPPGHEESNGLFPGLGYVPSPRDCAEER